MHLSRVSELEERTKSFTSSLCSRSLHFPLTLGFSDQLDIRLSISLALSLSLNVYGVARPINDDLLAYDCSSFPLAGVRSCGRRESREGNGTMGIVAGQNTAVVTAWRLVYCASGL